MKTPGIIIHHAFSPILAVILSAMILPGCNQRDAQSGKSAAEKQTGASERIKVFTSILPLVRFVERVGGARVEAEALARPGQSAETYEVTPRQIEALSRAKVLFRIGMPFEESLLRKIQSGNSSIRIVDLRESVALLDFAEAKGEHASNEDHASSAEHGDGQAASENAGAHHHEGKDWHVWLDPVRAKDLARRIAQTLIEAAPEHRAEFEANLASFTRDLDAIHSRIEGLLAPHRGRAFYAVHPSYAYFADRYGLRQEAIEHEGKAPGIRRVNELLEHMKSEGVRTLYAQPQYYNKNIQTVAAALKADVVIVDDLALEYEKNIEEFAQKLADGFAKDATRAKETRAK